MLACRFFAILKETLAVCTAVLTPRSRSLALVEENVIINRRCSTNVNTGFYFIYICSQSHPAPRPYN